MRPVTASELDSVSGGHSAVKIEFKIKTDDFKLSFKIKF